MKYVVFICTLIIMFLGCHQGERAVGTANSRNDSLLADTLSRLNHVDLYLPSPGGSGRDSLIRTIDDGFSVSDIFSVTGDTSQSLMIRVLAAEILVVNSVDSLSEKDKEQLAWVFSEALNDNLLKGAYVWVEPQIDSVRHGLLLNLVCELGESAKSAFTSLLSNEDLLWYNGSIESTIGNPWMVRKKDVAAMAISCATSIPFVFQKDISQRDSSIAEMKKQLQK